jgi:catechol 2,3-dioxygenase-like lactoylglutathione lyase family enzyme
MDMAVHLHHVHLNVQHREASLQFYEKHFNAKRILLNGATEALQATPTLLLFDEHESAPNGNLPTALQHMGWGTEDTAAWYEAAHARGLSPDTRGFTLFNTNETPTVGEPGSGAIIALSGAVPACFPVPDVAAYMYVLGPDQERIEVWSGAEGRVNHVHFTTADLAATSGWFQQFLGLPGAVPLLSYQFFLDDILFFFEPIGAAADYENTDDHTLAHVAFAVTSLDAWQKRVNDLQIEVVAEPAAAHGWNSFFVRGPDGLLIELVEAAKNPELCPR